ncbi:MAG: sigma-54 dependent transcriptional regulator [Chitinivibrionales bacterium]|nr:sigma-54 dependent transcriptional regulator [Chitinivibrionales bacterium]
MIRKGKILVVDDEASLRLLLSNELTRAGYSVEVAADGESALQRVREDFFHVVLLDIILPRMDGVSVLRTIKAEKVLSEIIILTGNATLESAIECIKLGAFEYIRKPYSINELIIQIERAIVHQSSQLDRRLLKERLSKRDGGSDTMVGTSPPMQQLRAMIARVAPTQSTVLILGGSGTGKELVARSIHEKSLVGSKQFVTINCASLPEHLLESELFGYEKGAFTDAKEQKRGLAEIADGGTLFLDEIGEIPHHFQAKLLRFLESGEIRRVGGTKDISLNVRILCATNKPLEELVKAQAFRADLYYRLNVVSILVPLLKTHREDIPLLVSDIIANLGFRKRFHEEALALLAQFDWPGNIRELRNVVERACIMSSHALIKNADLSFLNLSVTPPPVVLQSGESAATTSEPAPTLSLKEVQRRHIVAVLQNVKGHRAKAASILKITPKTLYQKIKDYNIVSVFE